jgi:uncharacterized protein YkwD
MKIVGRLFPVALVFACCYQAVFVDPVSVAALPHSEKSLGKSPKYSALELGVVAEMNRARANPRAYAQSLREWRRQFRGSKAQLAPGVFLQTQEGVTAVDEAIRVLGNTSTAPKLRLSAGLSRAARDHVLDQGPQGSIGHNGSNRSTPFERINRYGRWQKTAGENISYGPSTAAAVVRDLIVDDGVPDRGHRINIFRPDYRITGVACGHHKTYRVMCAISYAAAYREY